MNLPPMLLSRMKKELEMLENPPKGISAWPKDNKINVLEAKIEGPEGTPYEKGIFKLEINIPNRYPLEPPNVRFITPIYHPNVDNAGRICLDIINMPPKGAWKPSLNIEKVLLSLQSLIADPNADDGVTADISEQYKNNYIAFRIAAQAYTKKYAMDDSSTFTAKEAAATTTEMTKETSKSKSTKEDDDDDSSSSSSDDSSSDEEEADEKKEEKRKEEKKPATPPAKPVEEEQPPKKKSTMLLKRRKPEDSESKASASSSSSTKAEEKAPAAKKQRTTE